MHRFSFPFTSRLPAWGALAWWPNTLRRRPWPPPATRTGSDTASDRIRGSSRCLATGHWPRRYYSRGVIPKKEGLECCKVNCTWKGSERFCGFDITKTQTTWRYVQLVLIQRVPFVYNEGLIFWYTNIVLFSEQLDVTISFLPKSKMPKMRNNMDALYKFYMHLRKKIYF